MNPETFAVLGVPVRSGESTNPLAGARYTVPGLFGAELLVLQLVHEVVLCSPVGTPERPEPWPVTHYLDLHTRGGQHHPTSGGLTHPGRPCGACPLHRSGVLRRVLSTLTTSMGGVEG